MSRHKEAAVDRAWPRCPSAPGPGGARRPHGRKRLVRLPLAPEVEEDEEHQGARRHQGLLGAHQRRVQHDEQQDDELNTEGQKITKDSPEEENTGTDRTGPLDGRTFSPLHIGAL